MGACRAVYFQRNRRILGRVAGIHLPQPRSEIDLPRGEMRRLDIYCPNRSPNLRDRGREPVNAVLQVLICGSGWNRVNSPPKFEKIALRAEHRVENFMLQPPRDVLIGVEEVRGGGSFAA